MSNLVKLMELAGRVEATQSGQYPAMVLLVDVRVSEVSLAGEAGAEVVVEVAVDADEDAGDGKDDAEAEAVVGALHDPLARLEFLEEDETRRR